MTYTLNTTTDYHINDLNSLGWELTVCNSLFPEASPCRNALKSNKSFGVLLFNFLKEKIPFDHIHNILEIGGGLGNLMHGFLTLNPQLKAKMIDISPLLLAKQKEHLQGFNVDFQEMDALQIAVEELSSFDLVIMNENLGDLPTLVVDPENHQYLQENTYIAERAEYFIEKYELPVAKGENINIGAMEILEKLCFAGVKYIYLSEHSCEAVVPDHLKSYLHFETPGSPERIPLKGHDEYTIKFSSLQRIAQRFDYKVICGPFADFLKLDLNDQVRNALRQRVAQTDEQEILQHFVYDLYKYEYMILIKGGQS